MFSGCGCKEVYNYIDFLLIITYPYSSCICSFLKQHPYFLFIKKNVIYNYIIESVDSISRDEQDVP